MKLWKIVLCAMAFVVFASCGIQKTPPTPSSGVWLDIPSTVKIDTLSYTRLSWKMRNSFTFRWNYAKFASNQPFSFYSSASFARFWNPFNSFEMYWNRHNFWYEWAFGYPYFNHYYSTPRYYMYEQPRHVAIMKGRRGGLAYNDKNITLEERKNRVDVMAEKLKRKIELNENRVRNYGNPNKNWNNRSKFDPREDNNSNFNHKITPRENPNNFNNNNNNLSKNIGRSEVNSTKILMKK
jgi:hypothetical protein